MTAFYSKITGGIYNSSSYETTAPEEGFVPPDSIIISDDAYTAILEGLISGKVIVVDAGGQPQLVAPSQAAIIAAQVSANETAIQEAIDAKAQSRQYDSLDSAVSRYASPVATLPSTDSHYAQSEIWRLEANALKAWNSQVWASAYAYMDTVKAGTNPMPTADQAVAMMPTFTWPT